MPITYYFTFLSHFYRLTPTEEVNLLHTTKAAGLEVNAKERKYCRAFTWYFSTSKFAVMVYFFN
jgi:hypothetical protein